MEVKSQQRRKAKYFCRRITDKFTGTKTYETPAINRAKGDVIVDLDLENGEPVKAAIDVRHKMDNENKQQMAC